MEVSARNTLLGRIKNLNVGDIEVEVTVEIEEPQDIKILLPTQVLDRLNLKDGSEIEVKIDGRSIVLVKVESSAHEKTK